jgi:hypothetical protein
MPERDFKQQPPLEPLDRYAFGLGVKELNKQFYKSGEFVCAHLFRSPDINIYVQGKRVAYTFGSSRLSEADVMNGLEFRGRLGSLSWGLCEHTIPVKTKDGLLGQCLRRNTALILPLLAFG